MEGKGVLYIIMLAVLAISSNLHIDLLPLMQRLDVFTTLICSCSSSPGILASSSNQSAISLS